MDEIQGLCIITLAPIRPDLHHVSTFNQPVVVFNRFFLLWLKRLTVDCTNSYYHIDMVEMDQFLCVVLAMCVNTAVCIEFRGYWF